MSGKNNFSISSKFFFVLILWVILNVHYEIKDKYMNKNNYITSCSRFLIWFMNWFNWHIDLQGQKGMWRFQKKQGAWEQLLNRGNEYSPLNTSWGIHKFQ